MPVGVVAPGGLTPGTTSSRAPLIVPTDLRDEYARKPQPVREGGALVTGAETLMVNRRRESNTKFVDTSSPFGRAPRACARPAAAGRPRGRVCLREFRYNTEAAAPWTTQLAGAQPARPAALGAAYAARAHRPLDTVITPPAIALPVGRFTVPAGPPGAAQRIPVKPGHLVTLVAEGSIHRDDREIGPNGTDPRVRADNQRTGAAAAPGEAAPEYKEESRSTMRST